MRDRLVELLDNAPPEYQAGTKAIAFIQEKHKDWKKHRLLKIEFAHLWKGDAK